MTTEFWQLEQTLQEQGTEILCGVDEAGRGPLAGPVCAAAVILPPGLRIDGLNDSKKLTERKREALYEQIVAQARSYCVVMVDEACIDRINILQATLLAMQQAVNGLTVAPTLVLVDGNQLPKLPYPARAIVKGDARCASIAAASILAKVTRDRKMIALDTQYPGYGFAVHKGYGTKAHYEALEKLGPCEIHRQSFLKKFYERS